MSFFGGIFLGVAFGVAFMLCIARYQITRNARRVDLGIATGLIVGETEGVSFVTKGYRRNDDKKKWLTRDDKSHLKCKECGMSRHTKEQCFRIVGYPDWWTDGNKKGTKGAKTEKEKVPTTNTSSINKENTSGGRRSDSVFGGLVTAGNKGI
nr:hypothetical protein [Tanacetum cinerariifolium]